MFWIAIVALVVSLLTLCFLLYDLHKKLKVKETSDGLHETELGRQPPKDESCECHLTPSKSKRPKRKSSDKSVQASLKSTVRELDSTGSPGSLGKRPLKKHKSLHSVKSRDAISSKQKSIQEAIFGASGHLLKIAEERKKQKERKSNDKTVPWKLETFGESEASKKSRSFNAKGNDVATGSFGSHPLKEDVRRKSGSSIMKEGDLIVTQSKEDAHRKSGSFKTKEDDEIVALKSRSFGSQSKEDVPRKSASFKIEVDGDTNPLKSRSFCPQSKQDVRQKSGGSFVTKENAEAIPSKLGSFSTQSKQDVRQKSGSFLTKAGNETIPLKSGSELKKDVGLGTKENDEAIALTSSRSFNPQSKEDVRSLTTKENDETTVPLKSGSFSPRSKQDVRQTTSLFNTKGETLSDKPSEMVEVKMLADRKESWKNTSRLSCDHKPDENKTDVSDMKALENKTSTSAKKLDSSRAFEN